MKASQRAGSPRKLIALGFGYRRGMRVAVTVALISVVGVSLMIRSAVAVGFAVFIGPLVIAELVFLGGLYLVWRGLGGGGEAEKTKPPVTPRSLGRNHRTSTISRAQYGQGHGVRAPSAESASRLGTG